MQQRVWLVVLALALAVSAAQASRILEDGTSSARQLQQANARCPDGCAAGFCQQDATMAGLRCTKCSGTLIVKLVNGRCSCPRGKYSDGVTTQCYDCPKGSYCAGADFVLGQGSNAVSCPVNMTTIGKRTETQRGCVNLPGFYYTIDSTGTIVGSEQCPINTYSPGLKKQRACVPCPTGFITNGLVGQTRPEACVVPAGYYLKAPGQVAPCPKGEYKVAQGPNGNCTKCAFGVTTKLEGSTDPANCTDVVAGRYAVAIDASGTVTSTQVCPQKYYCPGGTPYATVFDPFNPSLLNNTLETTIYPCPAGTWTQDLGATSDDQCLTPPGFKTASGATTQCVPGEYRADWKPANQATNCQSCGVDVYADTTDRVKVYDILDPTNVTYIAITSTSDDCYIKPGQGLYYSTITGSWRARNCDSNNYGVPNITYGLTPAACKDCPAGMVATLDPVNYPNSYAYFSNVTDGIAWGFISALACVTQDGWGYNGRIAQQCDQGTYNSKDTRSVCTRCDYGLTTQDVGAGYNSSYCGIAAGFGYSATGFNNTGNYTIVPCPVGSYNNISWNSNLTAPCTSCPTGLTTEKEGSDSPLQCNLCAAGYGGTDCANQCGGVGVNATYGPPGRGVDTGSACLTCSYAGTGFSFEYNLTNMVYAPRAVSRVGANSSIDCLTEFTQMVDGAWYMPLNGANTNVTSTNQTTFEDCLAQCADDTCAFVNYNYDTTACDVVTPDGPLVSDPWVAWKSGPSGDTAVSAFAKKNNMKAKAVSSGFYSWYHDASALLYGTQRSANGTAYGNPTTIQDCLNICDDDTKCAGVTFQVALGAGATAANCQLVFGNTDLGQFTRTMLRTSLSNLAKPAAVVA